MQFNRYHIAQAQSVSEFLSAILSSDKGRSLSYADLGRLCGLKSRSHPREMVLGRKKASLAMAKQISRGLKLPADLRDFFLLLAEFELCRNLQTRNALEAHVDRARMLVRKRDIAKKKDSKDFFALNEASLVYAALGSAHRGAKLSDLVFRTKLSEKRIRSILARLQERGFVETKDQDSYFPTERHLAFSEIKAEGTFLSHYLSRIKQLHDRAKDHFQSDSELFWEATLSVNLRELPRLKEELRQTLNRFAEEAEDADGNSLRSISIGFFDPRQA